MVQPLQTGQQPAEQQAAGNRTSRGKKRPPYQYVPKETKKKIKPMHPVLLVILIILGILFWYETYAVTIMGLFGGALPSNEYHAQYEEDSADGMIRALQKVADTVSGIGSVRTKPDNNVSLLEESDEGTEERITVYVGEEYRKA